MNKLKGAAFALAVGFALEKLVGNLLLSGLGAHSVASIISSLVFAITIFVSRTYEINLKRGKRRELRMATRARMNTIEVQWNSSLVEGHGESEDGTSRLNPINRVAESAKVRMTAEARGDPGDYAEESDDSDLDGYDDDDDINDGGAIEGGSKPFPSHITRLSERVFSMRSTMVNTRQRAATTTVVELSDVY